MISDFYRKGFDNRNALNVYALFLLFFFSVAFLMMQGIDTGTIYFVLTTGSFIGMLFIFQFYKNDSSPRNVVAQYVRVPFLLNRRISSRWLLGGVLIPYLLYIFISNLTSFSVSTLSAPLFGNRLFSSFQTFSSSSILSSGAWQSFTTSFGAGVGETLTFSFFLVVAFVPLAFWFIGFFVRDPYRVNKNIVLIISILLVSGCFTGIHVLNATYVGFQFFIAFLFIFLSTLSIYYLGIPLIFWIGFHISWNQVIMIRDFGSSWFFREVLFSWYGVFLAGLILLISYDAFASRGSDSRK